MNSKNGYLYRNRAINVHTSAPAIAETGNKQHYQSITSDGILLNEIDRYDYWTLLMINPSGQGQWHALTAIWVVESFETVGFKYIEKLLFVGHRSISHNLSGNTQLD